MKNDRKNGSGRKLHGRFFKQVTLPTVHGRRQFSVLKPNAAAHVYITLEARVFTVRRREDAAWTAREERVHEGSVLLQRSGNRDRPIFAIYANLYDARRGLLHGIAGYDESEIEAAEGERPVMIAETSRFDDACALLAQWSRLKARERDALAESLAAFVARHERCRDEDKAAAVEEIDDASGFTDATGRTNPSASAAAVRRARAFLERRMDTIERIHPRESLRLAVVQGEITLAVETAREMLRMVERVFLPEAMDPRASLPRPMRATRFVPRNNPWAARISAQTRRLGLWKAQPFASDRGKVEIAMNLATHAFTVYDPKAAREPLERARRALALVLARHDLLTAVETIAIMPADPAKIPRRIERAKRLLREFHDRYRPLFPRVPDEDALPEWRRTFRLGTHALKAGDLLPAKTHLAAAAARLVA